jgi:DNA-binding MarR family transcriptional regulator
MARSRAGGSAEHPQRIDPIALRNSIGAALEQVYRKYPRWTLAQYLVALEVWIAQDEGSPHTVISLARKLGMPYSTASRVIWTLTEEGGDGVLKLEPHPTDRRKKYVVVNGESRNTINEDAITVAAEYLVSRAATRSG